RCPPASCQCGTPALSRSVCCPPPSARIYPLSLHCALPISTFLTRLRIGSKLVDAKGVSRLYRQRISTFQLALLALAGLAALAVALWATPGGQTMVQILGARLDEILSWFTMLFSPRATGA